MIACNANFNVFDGEEVIYGHATLLLGKKDIFVGQVGFQHVSV